MTECMREQVLKAFKTALDAIEYPLYPGLAPERIERNRDAFVQQFPAVVMIDGDSRTNYDNSGSVFYDMDVEVEGYIQTESPDDLGSTINALYAAILVAMLADTTLGQVAQDVREQDAKFEISRAQGQKPIAACSILFTVTFYTREGDPFS